jgi:hypothetical protein
MSQQPSHEDGFSRGDGTFHLIREYGGIRTPVETLDEPLSFVLPFDIPEEGELKVLRPVLKREEIFNIGSGRHVSHITELGYEPLDEDIPFFVQTAKGPYASMGACLTVGEDTDVLGTVVSGEGTFSLALGETLVEDKHIGHYVEITSGPKTGWKFHIKDHDTSGNVDTDIRVPDSPPGEINGQTFKIVGGPFKHYIRRGRTLPSFGGHFEVPNENSTQTVILDALGMIMKKNEITFEKDGDGKQAIGITIPKAVEGVAIPNLPQDLPDCNFFKWGHHSILEVEYDSQFPIVANRCDQVVHLIENEASVDPTQGDFWATYKNIKTVMYNLKLHYFPGGDTARLLYDLRNTRIKDYVTPLVARLEVRDPDYAQRDDLSYWDRYIKWVYTSCYLSEHPFGIPSKDDFVMGVDAEFRLLPEGELEIESQDEFGVAHYEGSGPTTTGITP